MTAGRGRGRAWARRTRLAAEGISRITSSSVAVATRGCRRHLRARDTVIRVALGRRDHPRRLASGAIEASRTIGGPLCEGRASSYLSPSLSAAIAASCRTSPTTATWRPGAGARGLKPTAPDARKGPGRAPGPMTGERSSRDVCLRRVSRLRNHRHLPHGPPVARPAAEVTGARTWVLQIERCVTLRDG